MVRAAQQLADGESVFLIGPAGCGKTQVIADAIKMLRGQRQLVLTHTHAGVGSLRQRLQQLDVPSERYRVDTIAGFALRWATSYPKTSRLEVTKPAGSDWNLVYPAAELLLRNGAIADIVAHSYDGLFVDEYQDCTVDQHELIVRLSDVLPTRLLGDPLQGIFDFAGETVDFDVHVRPRFEELPQLDVPYRWLDSNPKLGEWLLAVREPLMGGRPIEYLPSAIRLARKQNVVAECYRVADSGGSVVAIRKWPRDAHAIASRLSGRFYSMEELECKDLVTFAKQVEGGDSYQRAVAVVDFAAKCMTQVGTKLRPAKRALRGGGMARTRSGSSVAPAVRALNQLAASNEIEDMVLALHAIRDSVGGIVYRAELLREGLSVLKRHQEDPSFSLSDTAWEARNRIRFQLRRLPDRVVSRTLLIKGLEFDHSIVLDASELDAPNAYVAMTRGSHSLTVLT